MNYIEIILINTENLIHYFKHYEKTNINKRRDKMDDG